MSHIALLSWANTLISILKLFRSSSMMSLLVPINFLMSVVNKEIVLVLTASVHLPKQTFQTASQDHCNTLAPSGGPSPTHNEGLIAAGAKSWSRDCIKTLAFPRHRSKTNKKDKQEFTHRQQNTQTKHNSNNKSRQNSTPTPNEQSTKQTDMKSLGQRQKDHQTVPSALLIAVRFNILESSATFYSMLDRFAFVQFTLDSSRCY